MTWLGWGLAWGLAWELVGGGGVLEAMFRHYFLLFVYVVFVIVFLSFWCVIFDRFGNEKSIKMRLM